MNPIAAIELNLINAILQYLSKRPFDEVAMLIPELKRQAEESLKVQQSPANEVEANVKAAKAA